MKIKVSETTPIQLDWLVAKCEGAGTPYIGKSGKVVLATASYSTDWSQGGPILERERIATTVVPQETGTPVKWCAFGYRDPEYCRETKRFYGPTMLIAGLRCYCCSKLGEVVDIPEELCQ